jgi:hypothetical protein
MVQAAFVGVPLIELFVRVHKGIEELKLSDKGVAVKPELDVALDVKLMDCPEQMAVEETDAATAVGMGLTVTAVLAVAEYPPGVETVSV